MDDQRTQKSYCGIWFKTSKVEHKIQFTLPKSILRNNNNNNFCNFIKKSAISQSAISIMLPGCPCSCDQSSDSEGVNNIYFYLLWITNIFIWLSISLTTHTFLHLCFFPVSMLQFPWLTLNITNQLCCLKTKTIIILSFACSIYCYMWVLGGPTWGGAVDFDAQFWSAI